MTVVAGMQTVAHGLWPPRRIGFLGPRATFAEQALRTLPEAADAELVACAGSPAVLAEVRAGTVDAAAIWRSRMPVRCTIHSSVVCTERASSSLERMRFGR